MNRAGGAESSIADSPSAWFVRGAAVGGLLMAAINAVSYFVRSTDWTGLVGPPATHSESLGFPWVIWEGGNTYGGWFVDYPNVAWNGLVAVVIGICIGCWAARQSAYLNQWLPKLTPDSDGRRDQPIQFSLLGLMIVTTIVAVVTMLAKTFAARPETLVVIYVLGPTLLVGIAMLPRQLVWQKRVMIIIPATVALIAIAIAIGVVLGMEFDKVMMGIFLCWTPQSVLAALGLSLWLWFMDRDTHRVSAD